MHIFLQAPLTLLLLASPPLTPQENITLFLELNDSYGALTAAKAASVDLETYLQVLASFPRGEMNQELQKSLRLLHNPSLTKLLMEQIAWAFIRKSSTSSNLQLQLSAACHAAESNTKEGVEVLYNLLTKPSAIKEQLFSIVSHLPDHCFLTVAAQSLQEDPHLVVRKEALRLLGTRKDPEAKETLEAHLKKIPLHPEEQFETLAALQSHIRFDKSYALNETSTTIDKLLMIQGAMENPTGENIATIATLVDDTDEQVECMALLAIGLFGDSEVALKGTPLQENSLLRQWVGARRGKRNHTMIDLLAKECTSSFPHVRLQAVTLLCSLGPKSQEILLQLLSNPDPIVQLNAAVTLTRQGSERGAQRLLRLMTEFQGLLSKSHYFLFPQVQSSLIPNSPVIPRLPEVVDMFTRLELIALVARNSPCDNSLLDIRSMLQHYLTQKPFGIAGEAALYFQRDFEHEGLEIVESLLESENQTIRLQAALILGLLCADDRGVDILLDEYPTAPFDMKMTILKALGSSSTKKVQTFLLQQLQDPSEFLQLEAAGALLASLKG